MSASALDTLIDTASHPYRAAGWFAWYFARGKLRFDPWFVAVLENGLLADRQRILDLGCGQGLLAAWLTSAAEWHRASQTTVAIQPAIHPATRRTSSRNNRTGCPWPAVWPAPPQALVYRGVEMTPADLRRARLGLQQYADCCEFVARDLGRDDGASDPAFAPDVVLLIDVLHYLDDLAQRALLARIFTLLQPDGLLLLRVGDTADGWRAWLSRGVDRLVHRVRSGRDAALCCRSASQWRALLHSSGYQLEPLPPGCGAHRPNLLLRARPAPRAIC